MDLRERVVAAIQGGMSCRAAAGHFSIGESTAIRWARRARETGAPAPLRPGGRRPFVLAGEADWLRTRFAEKPDITLREVLAELHERGIEVSYYGVWNMTGRLGLSFKKKPARQRTGSRRRRSSPGTVEATTKER
jgi:transposase